MEVRLELSVEPNWQWGIGGGAAMYRMEEVNHAPEKRAS